MDAIASQDADDDAALQVPGDDELAIRRAGAAARQRRHRAGLTDDQREAGRAKGRERKRATRRSPEYRALPPEEKWAKKGGKGLPLRLRPFVGVDGEGGNVVTHAPDCAEREVSREPKCGCLRTHHYAAMTVGDRTLQNPDGQPLGSMQLIKFLADQPTRSARFVSFFFDYDVTFILRDLHPDTVRRILNPSPAEGPLKKETSEQ